MNREKLQSLLEEQGIEQEKIDEVIGELSLERDEGSVTALKRGEGISDELVSLEKVLGTLPFEEWRKRAAIQARIISLKLDS